MSKLAFDYIECPTHAPVVASVILMHGLGASADDFVPIVSELQPSDDECIRFILPNAPIKPVTINGGAPGPAWYDLYHLDFFAGIREDEVGIRQAERGVHELIAREMTRGLRSEQIFLAGFSQGGALALHTALRYPKRLAGVLALSTYLPIHQTVANERHEANAQTPIFLAHGLQDPVLPYVLAQFVQGVLTSLGHMVQLHTYPMMHQVIPQEIVDIKAWFNQCLEAHNMAT